MARALSQLRLVKPPTPKTQKKMHMKSVLKELVLVIKMTISSKTHKENQTRTKKADARMQWFEFSMNDTTKLLIESPLDSTAIDPITRSPNYHHETGKIENLSRANLCLAHGPLELDDDDLDSLKLDHLSWLCWLDED